MTDYSAIVRHPGNTSLFDAVEMSLLALMAGWPLHLHAEGVRGTGKTTVLRAARALLPPIERIAGCPYNCRPDRPHCPQHRELSAEDVQKLGRETVPRPFLEISHSAKLGTVAGSIDLGGLSRPEGLTAALLPGTLPRAHRGVVIVDEINRLAETAPELADMLLDAMGTRPGRVQIEESGLPHVTVPIEIVVWAASNPDEDPGPLSDVRRQLSDRFDLNVGIERPPGPEWVEQVLAVLARRLGASTANAQAGADGAAHALSAGAVADTNIDRRPSVLVGEIGQVEVPANVRRTIADVYSKFGLESLRAAEGLYVGAQAAAVRAGERAASIAGLRRVAPLVLRHRLEPERLQRCLHYLDELIAKPVHKTVAMPFAKEPTADAPSRPAEQAARDTATRWPPANTGTAASPAATQPAATAAMTGTGQQIEPPLLRRFWQRLAGQTARSAAAGGDRSSSQQPGGHQAGQARMTSSAAANGSAPTAGQAVAPTGTIQAPTNASELAPPEPARPLRQLPPEQWVAGPEQLWRHR